ncbi:hypothetical protein HYX10_03850 [Candidatus Woesearchaeota archaeon]|nr:hypothetical protein [Candidatus Woesearchaeota archaeon]
MKKRKQTKVLLPFSLKNALILIAVLVIFSAGIFQISKNQDSKITGYAISENPEQPAAQSSTASIPETDVVVWQGQYFKGTEFQTGTFDFNFTVYDAKVGGGMLF